MILYSALFQYFFIRLKQNDNIMVQDSFQLNGTNTHKHSDSATYSTKNKWLKQFDQTDSVYIFNLSNSCKVEKYGYERNEDSDLLIVK